MDLSLRHTDYLATAESRGKSRDLYEGNDVVKAAGEKYLFKEKNEDQDSYDLRLKRAVLDPYVEKIVEARQAIMFRRPATRTLPAELENLANDVDMKGTPANVFFQNAAREAQIDGVHWVLIDKPRVAPGVVLASKRAEAEAGLRPFFQQVPGSAVVDWHVGEDLQLEWAVVEQCSIPGPRQPGKPIDPKKQWKVWTRTDWALYEAPKAKTAPGISIVQTDGGRHGLGLVPLVPFLGIPHTDFSGWPVADLVLDTIILLYNKASDLDWFERLSSHPIPYVIAPNKPTKLDAGAGLYIKSDASGGDVQVGYLETTGAPFQSLRDSTDRLHQKILALTLAQAQKSTAQVQSGDSQREDRKIFTSSLMSASQSYQFAEQRCWNVMAKWIGRDGSGVEISYIRDFDDKFIEAQMVEALNALCDAGRLSSGALLKTLKENGALPDWVDPDDELRKAREEQASRSADVLKAMQDIERPEPGTVDG